MKPKHSNLIGREVYIKMSKKEFDKLECAHLFTLGKKYKITRVYKYSLLLVGIQDNKRRRIPVLLSPRRCSFLDHKAGWILARAPQDSKQDSKQKEAKDNG